MYLVKLIDNIMNKKLLLKKYIRTNYLKNYSQYFIKNDFIVLNLYLKTTSNFLYDSSLNLILENLKEKNFKWYFKNLNIILFKKNISILELCNLLELKNLYFILLKLNNNFYYNIYPSFFLFKDNINFFFNFYSLFLKNLINLLLILKLKLKN